MALEFYYMQQYQDVVKKLDNIAKVVSEHVAEDNKKANELYASRRAKILKKLEKLNRYADKGNTLNEIILDEVKRELTYLDRDYDAAMAEASKKHMKLMEARLNLEDAAKKELHDKVPNDIVMTFINEDLKAKLN